jgi:tRNA threonylcarbamoyladenosine modification (KEOPS) complex  Pcc1 subunit
MKALLEIDFRDSAEAKKVLGILGKKDEGPRAVFEAKAVGKKVVATVSAKSFSALRARTTTLLRDLKAVFDVTNLVEKNQERKKH